ncbi:MAG: hypothetical protein WBB74_07795 [Gaiellaceae bacterium]
MAISVAAGSTAAAGGGVVSASGASHFTIHNFFGLNTIVVRDFSWSASENPQGTVNGWFNYQDVEDGALFTARGDVTCIAVKGNDAWVGGTFVASNDPSLVGLDTWWHVTDNGEGANAPPDITTLLGAGGPGTAQAFCDKTPPYKYPWQVEHGSIQVRG